MFRATSVEVEDMPALREVVETLRDSREPIVLRLLGRDIAVVTPIELSETEMTGVPTRAQYDRAMSASNRRPCAGVLLELRALVGVVDIRHDAKGTRLVGVEVRVERERGQPVEADRATPPGDVRLDFGRFQGALLRLRPDPRADRRTGARGMVARAEDHRPPAFGRSAASTNDGIA